LTPSTKKDDAESTTGNEKQSPLIPDADGKEKKKKNKCKTPLSKHRYDKFLGYNVFPDTKCRS
jgi:hypothetical protein